ncbi:bifunctional diguanylate cyclase/phosphodiesterase [Thauera sinica]|uniref:Diguanylate cyclase domain-containing protein n=1 Tax=Thauera sinica TaxID=2665146 RepID=A0ABW1APQ7_9RHOO|nr:diguanylate cyclase [Thauera sp. K11]
MQQPLRAIRVAIVVVSAFALAVGWYDTVTGLREAERDAMERLRIQAIIQARAAGEAVEGAIGRFDVALRMLQLGGLESAARFPVQGRIVTAAMSSDLLLQAFVVGSDGYLAYSSLGEAPRNFLGDREYFRALAASDDDRLFISRPVIGRLTRKWSIQLVRAMRRNGRFDGVVALAVSPEVWSRKLLRFGVHPLDTLTLLDGDGHVLLRTLDGNEHLGKQAPAEREYRLYPERREGHYVAHASLDGVLRMYGWTRLSSGLVMLSGIALEPALEPIRALRSRTVMSGVVSSGLFVFVIAALLIALRRYERAVQRLGEREEHYRSLLEHMAEGLVVLDAENRIVSVNPAFSAITGFGRSEVMQRPVSMLSNGRTLDHVMTELSDPSGSGHWEGDFDGVRPGGEGYTGHAVISSLRDANGAVRHRVALITDVTERRRRDDEIWRQANFDRLTGLPNRALLTDRLESMLRHARRQRSGVAVLFIDLDRFKPVNDEFGHDVGDLLLRQVARRLQGVFRDEDTVARIGGDEFVAAMQGEDCAAGSERAAAEVVAQLSQPFFVEDRRLLVGCSVGIACFPADGDSAESLVNAADRAMYRAKNGGRGRWSR